jgi:hypothetical protein
MQSLMRLAGFSLPLHNLYQEPIPQTNRFTGQPKTEHEQIEERLKAVRQEIARLSQLPIVKLSLDVKLARHQRRDLLGEMAYDLQRKVGRKIAEPITCIGIVCRALDRVIIPTDHQKPAVSSAL